MLLAKVVINGWRIDLMGWLTAFGTVITAGAVILAFLNWRGTQMAARRHEAELITGWLRFGEEDTTRPVSLRGIAYTSRERVWTPGDKLDRKGGGYTGPDGKRLFRAVTIQNGSHQVMSNVIVGLVNDPRASASWPLPPPRTRFLEVPPGLTGSMIEIPSGQMSDRPKIAIAFVDHNGKRWIRRDGKLDETDKDPSEYFGETEPFEDG